MRGISLSRSREKEAVLQNPITSPIGGTTTLGFPPKRGDEFARVLGQQIERAVMAGNDGIEGEIAMHGLRRRSCRPW